MLPECKCLRAPVCSTLCGSVDCQPDACARGPGGPLSITEGFLRMSPSANAPTAKTNHTNPTSKTTPTISAAASSVEVASEATPTNPKSNTTGAYALITIAKFFIKFHPLPPLRTSPALRGRLARYRGKKSIQNKNTPRPHQNGATCVCRLLASRATQRLNTTEMTDPISIATTSIDISHLLLWYPITLSDRSTGSISVASVPSIEYIYLSS